MNRHLSALGLCLASAGLATPGLALAQGDIDQARNSMSKLIGLLVEQGVLKADKAENLMKEVTAPPPPAPAPASNGRVNAGTVRVPYVPQFVRDELKQELRAELAAQAKAEGWAGPGAVPEWVRGLSWEGDLRLRLQADRYADGNAPALSISETNRNRAQTLLNTTENRERLRVRARMGLNARIDDSWAAGVRLTTGSSTDPVSSNQTLGTYGNRFTASFDRAYVRYRYGDQLNVVAGRFGNPWFGTDLVWANDLSFDGVALQWQPNLGHIGRGFVTVAAMPVQEVELSANDKWLFGAQVGAELPNFYGRLGGKIGLGYYSYSNIVGKTSAAGSSLNEFTAPAFAQKGNTYYNISSDPNRPLLGLASDYHLVNLTGMLSMPVFDDKRLSLSADYVKNIGFKRQAVAQRTGFDVEPQTAGYQLRLAVGSPEVAKFGDWQVYAGYKRVERDAVLDAFTDGDFRLGGTDAKGYILGASYGLGKNTAAHLRVLSADSISGPPLGVDVFQVDLTVRY